MAEEERAYAGMRPCGCVCVLCTHDMPPKDLAKELAYMARHGLSIERVTRAEIKTLPWECETCKPLKARKKIAAQLTLE